MVWEMAARPAWGWRHSWGICGRCSSALPVARARPRRWACWSASAAGWGWARAGACSAWARVSALSPWAPRGAGGFWLARAVALLVVALVSRYSSLASLVAAAFAPVCYLLMGGAAPLAAAMGAMALLLAWRHRDNIRRLIAGKEARLGGRKAVR